MKKYRKRGNTSQLILWGQHRLEMKAQEQCKKKSCR